MAIPGSSSIYRIKHDRDSALTNAQEASAKVIGVTVQRNEVVIEANADLTDTEAADVARAVLKANRKIIREPSSPSDTTAAQEIDTRPNAVYLHSPDGSRWKLSVDDLGVLTTVSV